MQEILRSRWISCQPILNRCSKFRPKRQGPFPSTIPARITEQIAPCTGHEHQLYPAPITLLQNTSAVACTLEGDNCVVGHNLWKVVFDMIDGASPVPCKVVSQLLPGRLLQGENLSQSLGEISGTPQLYLTPPDSVLDAFFPVLAFLCSGKLLSIFSSRFESLSILHGFYEGQICLGQRPVLNSVIIYAHTKQSRSISFKDNPKLQYSAIERSSDT